MQIILSIADFKRKIHVLAYLRSKLKIIEWTYEAPLGGHKKKFKGN